MNSERPDVPIRAQRKPVVVSSQVTEEPTAQTGGRSQEWEGCVPITARLKQLLSEYSHEEVARWASISAESVRRYLMGQVPPLKFFASVCQHEQIRADWILTGVGSPYLKQRAEDVLRETPLPMLLAEVGRRLDLRARER